MSSGLVLSHRPGGPTCQHPAQAAVHEDDNIVVCVLESILTTGEDAMISAGESDAVINGRVAFQSGSEDEFTAAIERLTHRRVVAFMGANQTDPGVACELFFLDAAPLAVAGSPA